MHKSLKLLLLGSLTLSLASCASYFKRKECEKTNWFQHGQDVAMRGQNLENDPFLNQCRKVEADIGESALDQGFKKGRANYCEPQTVFITGKKGEPFSADMCDGGNLKVLRQKHLQGVREYCLPSNGETAGATGNPYKNVCPKDMESAFMPEFKKGRKKYLHAQVVSREGEVQDIDREIADLDRQRQRKMYELAAMGNGGSKTITRTRRVGPTGVSVQDQVSVTEDDSAKQARDELKREIDQLDWQIKQKRNAQSEVREQVRQLRAEMLTL